MHCVRFGYIYKIEILQKFDVCCLTLTGCLNFWLKHLQWLPEWNWHHLVPFSLMQGGFHCHSHFCMLSFAVYSSLLWYGQAFVWRSRLNLQWGIWGILFVRYILYRCMNRLILVWPILGQTNRVSFWYGRSFSLYQHILTTCRPPTLLLTV